ncbi:hypothetical protein LSH36_213g04070 [Paralvinella palmiformis]|uniref:Uncharacterized protein n=1 Tax=Paralvinella palmiformis TaxID=53620 RepID=A0AAD9JNH0_9ANNE|nr:hypothetical protein LSH36_213g04070 [Paralvinella palmiformis]
MDRLRHHLMPLYNFDPMEEEGDWESELLEEEKEQQVALNIRVSVLEMMKYELCKKLNMTMMDNYFCDEKCTKLGYMNHQNNTIRI